MLEHVIKFEITASAVAWYGAIVATFSLLFVGLNYLRDRAKIKVKINFGYICTDAYSNGAMKIIGIEVINKGRRSVTLHGAGFHLSDNRELWIPLPLFDLKFPYELNEGKSMTIHAEWDTISKDLDMNGISIKYGWAKDATGKIYKARFKHSFKKTPISKSNS